MNIAKNLENAACHFPDNMALMADSNCLTYRQFNAAADRIARALQKKGVRAGDHIGLCAPIPLPGFVFISGSSKPGLWPSPCPIP
jgi:non-ribosomal peptide synthetase component F